MLKDGWDYIGMPKKRTVRFEIINIGNSEKFDMHLNNEVVKRKNKKANHPFYETKGQRLIVEFEWDGSFTVIDITQH